LQATVSSHINSPNTFFPTDLIQETLQTLALLLPELDPATKTWYAQQSTRRHSKRATKTPPPPLDPLARENGQLKASARQISKFPYWSERLTVLKQVFDEAEPTGVQQWWWDRRRRVQWYTFWVTTGADQCYSIYPTGGVGMSSPPKALAPEAERLGLL